MSHASTSSDSISGGYAKFRAGGSRVLADDSAVFSLDEDENVGCSSSVHFTREGEKSRLVECPLDSEGEEDDEEMERRKRINRSTNQNKGSSNGQNPSSEHKPIGKVDNSLTRLTSSSIYDLDAEDVDSMASDELDLLPPIPTTTNGPSSPLKSLSSIFSCCCKPRRIPLKCSIM
uniref:Uncharacterized protein n=1 Tax=Pristionchus pacificus TaxID=54126 RepID=A0A8R1V4Z7_PRIPA